MKLSLIPLEERIVLNAALVAVVVHQLSEAAAHHLYVTVNGTGNGSSWADATNLQHALQLASSSSSPIQLWVEKGTYIPGTSQTSTFDIPNDVSIYGGFNGTETSLSQRNPSKNVTILSGALGNDINSYHVVTIETAGENVTLDGITIQDGVGTQILNDPNNDQYGAGIFSLTTGGVDLTLNNVVLQDNQDLVQHQDDGIGAAYYVVSTSVPDQLVVTNSVIQDNSGGFNSPGTAGLLSNGSVIYQNDLVQFNHNDCNGVTLFETVTGSVSNSIFQGNTTLDGGAIRADDSTLTITNSKFLNNQAQYSSGALEFNSSYVTISNSIFSGNTVQQGNGGAIYTNVLASSLAGTLTVIDCQFDDNSASEGGGAINALNEQNFTVESSTFNNNSGGTVGAGAIVIANFTNSFGQATISNSIFTNNSATGPGTTGGAIEFDGSNNILITSNLFSNNSVEGGGGAIEALVNSGTAQISNNIFQNNSAYGSTSNDGALGLGATGGAIDLNLNSGPITIKNNVFIDNSAYYGGGAISGGNGGDQENIISNVFIGNHAQYGGAVYDGSGAPNPEFTGQDFYAPGTTSLLISGNVFAANSASLGGNSIFLDGTQGSVDGQTKPAQIINELVLTNFVFNHDIDIL